jgi:hypothetical protein
MYYLSEQEVVELFNRITEKFPHGDIILDAYNSLMTWAMNLVVWRNKGRSISLTSDRPLAPHQNWLPPPSSLLLYNSTDAGEGEMKTGCQRFLGEG